MEKKKLKKKTRRRVLQMTRVIFLLLHKVHGDDQWEKIVSHRILTHND